MKFEETHCYKFANDRMVMCVVGRLKTAAWGETLVGEVIARGSFPSLRPVGSEEKHADHWSEISGAEFLSTAVAWSQEIAELARRKMDEKIKQDKDRDLPVDPSSFHTAMREVVAVITHPEKQEITLFLKCGHTIKRDYSSQVVEKKGDEVWCEKCNLQNRAWFEQVKAGDPDPSENRRIAKKIGRTKYDGPVIPAK